MKDKFFGGHVEDPRKTAELKQNVTRMPTGRVDRDQYPGVWIPLFLKGYKGIWAATAWTQYLFKYINGLRGDVGRTVPDGKFHVFAVTTIDQAIEILTGVAAGEPDTTGNWPASSVNGRIAHRLQQFLALRLAYAKGGKQKHRPGSKAQP